MQIAKIIAKGSAKGISLSGILLESIAIAIAFAYNYHVSNPFSTYGEGAFLLFQNTIIIILILGYSKKYLSLFTIIAAHLALGLALYDQNLISMDLLVQLQFSSIFVGIASRLPQILSNAISGSTGQLSLVTTLLQFVGTLARVFTTLQEVTDVNLLYSIAISAFLNGVLLVQVVVLGDTQKLVEKDGKKVQVVSEVQSAIKRVGRKKIQKE